VIRAPAPAVARRSATLLLVVLALASTTAPPAAAYAGMTRAVAVAKARRAEYAALAYGVNIGTVTAVQARALRRRVASEAPRVLEGRCDGKPAWKVIWPKSTAIMVGSGVGPKPATLCR
jgi:hypothetical protein